MIGKADLRRKCIFRNSSGNLISSAGFGLDLLAGRLSCGIKQEHLFGGEGGLCVPVPESRTEGTSRWDGEVVGFCTQQPGRAGVGCLSPRL